MAKNIRLKLWVMMMFDFNYDENIRKIETLLELIKDEKSFNKSMELYNEAQNLIKQCRDFLSDVENNIVINKIGSDSID